MSDAIQSNDDDADKKKKAKVDWRQKCVEEWNLKEIPEDWRANHPALVQKSSADNDVWERYYNYRKEQSLRNNEEEDVDEAEDWPLGEIRKGLREEAAEIGYPDWYNHSIQYITDCTLEDYREIRSITIRAVIFSPFALPQAVVIEHRYHHRARSYEVEFYCYWHFRLLRFDDKPIKSKIVKGGCIGDSITKRHAKHWPEGWVPSSASQSQYYIPDDEMEVLCNNGFQDPPTVEEGSDHWCAVENIDVSNFTPSTVRRIRGWIFGSLKSMDFLDEGPLKSMDDILDDFDLLRLLFASVGSRDFDTFHQGGIGHCHCFNFRNEELAEELIADGVVMSKEEVYELPDISWLEYQARLVSGALRPVDRYYEPYDYLQAKGEWAESILRRYGDDDVEDSPLHRLVEEGEVFEDLAQAPWIFWERASQYGGLGSRLDQLMRIMQAQFTAGR